MLYGQEEVLAILACVFAAGAGWGTVLAIRQAQVQRVRRAQVRKGYLDSDTGEAFVPDTVSSGLSKRVLRYLVEQSRIAALKPHSRLFTQGVWAYGSKSYGKAVSKTGLSQEVNEVGYRRARAQLCLALCCCCSLVGAVFSTELMVLLGLCGAAAGWRLPLWALKREKDARKDDLEEHLSEMLEVVSLGLRGGLSFDRSFELYHRHFSTYLARGCASAQRRWQLGLEKREDALRGLAAAYDSALFSRAVENIIRSLRFGASLADSLEAAALEARVVRKANREEAVAKAPVKMLVPTAALILPAMLLFVLGPVLLDMMQGL